MTPRVTPFGEAALLVELGDAIDESLIARANAIADAWTLGPAIPSYVAVVLEYDADAVTAEDAERRARELLARGPAGASAVTERRLVEIPTRYDGPDLADIAQRSGMTVAELVAAHSGREYTAFFLGFMPGLAYMGRLDPRIVAPRLERPRVKVPAGTVGVVDGQTTIYPFTSPGGWRLIGSTDLVMFDPAAPEPSRLRAGDRVRFVPT